MVEETKAQRDQTYERPYEKTDGSLLVESSRHCRLKRHLNQQAWDTFVLRLRGLITRPHTQGMLHLIVRTGLLLGTLIVPLSTMTSASSTYHAGGASADYLDRVDELPGVGLPTMSLHLAHTKFSQ